jgi:predicted aldo/keto reductase-like oxidoreductase
MNSRPRTVVLVLLLASLVVGFAVSGALVYKAAIGLDPSAFPAGPAMQAIGKALLPDLAVTVAGLVLAILPLLIVAALALVAVVMSMRAARQDPDASRRSFLIDALAGTGTALGAIVLGAAAALARAFAGVGNGGRGWAPIGGEIFGGEVVKTHPSWEEVWKGSRVQAYRRLGRTEWRVSDIVMGTGRINGEKGVQVAKLGIERGINYIDTSPDYSSSGSESAIGQALRGVDRSKLFIATKFCTPTGHLPPGTPVAVYKENVAASLSRLGVEYVDLIHVHSCDEIERLLDPNMHEAFRELKEEGRARFLGFSTHTPNLVQVAGAAIESGKFDVMMLAYHHGIWPRIGEVIERARREQDMGVVAMKNLKGGRHHGLAGFREEAQAYSQAALKWSLSNPDLSCAVISFFELQHVDEYLFASGVQPDARDQAILEKYDRQILGSYCAPHCGACLSSCPEGVPIHDVLRHRMYFEDYGWEKEALRLYSKLGKNAAGCAACSAPCMGSCPVGIPIQERVVAAHQQLTLA